MPYWAFIALAIAIHLIINFDTLKRPQSKAIYSLRPYKVFLTSLLIFFITDLLWGIFDEHKMALALYIDTVFYFIFMGLTVFLWMHFVIRFLQGNKVFARVVEYVGFSFFVAEVVLIIINFFYKVLFDVDPNTAKYIEYGGRYIMLYVQISLYFALFVYTLVVALKYKDKKFRKYFAVSVFSLVNASFITIQLFDPYLPLYSMGLLVGLCFLHAFMVTDIRQEITNELSISKQNEKAKEQELGNAIQLAYTDPLTKIKNKYAYVEMEERIDKQIAKDEIKEFAIIVFDLNGLKTINDTKGHDAGDKYIVQAVRTISNYFGDKELYRFGGDEFVLIMDDERYKNRKNLIDQFNRYIEGCINTDKPVISAGMSIYRRGQDNTYRAVFNRADKIMYSRKEMLKEREG